MWAIHYRELAEVLRYRSRLMPDPENGASNSRSRHVTSNKSRQMSRKKPRRLTRLPLVDLTVRHRISAFLDPPGVRIMWKFPTAAATVALVTSLIAFSMAAHAAPAMSWSSDDVDYDQSICVQRAEAAFGREQWKSIHPSGNPPLGIAAHKGSLSGLILCLDRAIGANHAVAVVFVTGGGEGVADRERDRLHDHMRD
jgi:hypothetical protein